MALKSSQPILRHSCQMLLHILAPKPPQPRGRTGVQHPRRLKMKRFCFCTALAILPLLALSAGRREYTVGSVPPNSVIWVESYSPMEFDITSFTVYPDGTVLRGTNSYS